MPRIFTSGSCCQTACLQSSTFQAVSWSRLAKPIGAPPAWWYLIDALCWQVAMSIQTRAIHFRHLFFYNGRLKYDWVASPLIFSLFTFFFCCFTLIAALLQSFLMRFIYAVSNHKSHHYSYSHPEERTQYFMNYHSRAHPRFTRLLPIIYYFSQKPTFHHHTTHCFTFIYVWGINNALLLFSFCFFLKTVQASVSKCISLSVQDFSFFQLSIVVNNHWKIFHPPVCHYWILEGFVSALKRKKCVVQSVTEVAVNPGLWAGKFHLAWLSTSVTCI